ncbi:glycosyltransferase family 39 protein [Halobacillus locisalis]|uniref:Glycosyltransferase family 39 protein n=1 Tax=Halobacillus locisalis TaxID=220753 RepID=A0A838CTW4_9BACI|nr:glycosyltransferase family 39 protein [Halobacillus locisalis]MBA2175323.1 glycosyltransferase family 39 protein [Halobacillus locisalis]
MINKYFKLFCAFVILTFGLIYMGAGVYFNWLSFDELYVRPDLLIGLGSIAAMALTYLLTSQKLSTRVFIISLLGVSFLVRILWVLYVPAQPVSDFYILHRASMSASEGNFAFMESDYFQRWVYQLGFVMYQAFLLFIFGDQLFPLQLINILLSCATVFIVYKIGVQLFNERVGRLSGIVYTFYLPTIIMTSLLTNQILATFLFYLGAYLLVRHFEKSTWVWAVIGVLFAFGHIIRPLGPFVLLATGLFIFVVFMLGKRLREALFSAGKLAGVIATYSLVLFIVSQSLMLSGVSDYPLENRDPLWKFVIGLNHETSGTYSDSDLKLLNQYEGEERVEKERELIEERLEDPSRLVELFRDKFEMMWANLDASVIWGYGDRNENVKERLFQLEKAMYFPLFLYGGLGILGLFVVLKRNAQDPKQLALFFVLFIIGYAMIHLLIEIQTRYRFVLMPSLIVIQSYGVYMLYEGINKLKSRIDSRKVE